MLNKLKAQARVVEQSGFSAALALARQRGCIDLGVGLCNLKMHPLVLEAAQRALAGAPHCYTQGSGIASLKTAITNRYGAYNHLEITPANVLVTCGATGAFESICKSFLEPGDEVVMFEPFYQYHVRQVLERGARIRYVHLMPPRWTFSAGELDTAITNKTKLLVMANPNNPTGKVFSGTELELIGNTCRKAGVVVVCDEVYEYLVRPGASHISMASLPGMFDSTLTLSSAGKTFQVTGWRIGWLVGPSNVMGIIGTKAEETYLCAPAPLQYAAADCLAFEDEYFAGLQRRFEEKRARMLSALRVGGFQVHASEGAFYALVGYEGLGYRNDSEAVAGIIEDFGVMAIPGSVFCSGCSPLKVLRFCFAVDDDLLSRACERLECSPTREKVELSFAASQARPKAV